MKAKEITNDQLIECTHTEAKDKPVVCNSCQHILVDCTCTKQNPFQREDRYIVIKRSDASWLSERDQFLLSDLENVICGIRSKRGKDVLKSVVIESDWPEYETVWKMIEDRMTAKGKPEPVDDEPDQQRCNHCMTISDAELPACPKCGRDDALMFPFEEVKPEPVEPWQKLLEYDSYTRIGLAIQQLQRRHDAMQKQIEEHVIRPNKSMSVGGTASGPT